jgi:L-asparagine transporter-like permease
MLGSVAGYVALTASIVSPQRVFSFLVNASGASMLFIYLLAAFAQLRLRSRAERDGAKIPIKMWLHPWVSYGAIAAMIAVLVAMAATPALESQFYCSLVLAGILFLAHCHRTKINRAR